MSSAKLNTALKMLESLPDHLQDRVVEHLREYVEDLRDEMKWDRTFKKNSEQLIRAAKKAKKEIEAGESTPLDLKQL
ncbi:MAG: hypothetical protein NTW14_00940 [bacterium]|nr:hypothetical protein [bacterium]